MNINVENTPISTEENRFYFFKVGEDILAPKDGKEFNWHEAAQKT